MAGLAAKDWSIHGVVNPLYNYYCIIITPVALS